MMLNSLKQKIAKVGIGLFCAGCVFLSSAAYSQAASYTAYALKLNKTNNFTSMHAKTTSDDYITNEVTAITNTSYANFWAVNNSKSKISNKYKQGVGTGSCNLIFTKSGYNSNVMCNDSNMYSINSVSEEKSVTEYDEFITYKDANDNEIIPVDRERYKSIYETDNN